MSSMKTMGSSSTLIKTEGTVFQKCIVNASCTLSKFQNSEKCIIFGGFHLYSGEVYSEILVLDTKTYEWTTMNYIRGTPPSARNDHVACLWQDKK